MKSRILFALLLIVPFLCNATTNVWSFVLTNYPGGGPPPVLAVDGAGGCAIAYNATSSESGPSGPTFVWLSRTGKPYVITNFVDSITTTHPYLDQFGSLPHVVLTPTRLVFTVVSNTNTVVMQYTRTGHGIVSKATTLAPSETFGTWVPPGEKSSDPFGFFTIDHSQGKLTRWRY